MARKEKQITIEDRGQNLTFVVREMPAVQMERWLYRVMLLLAGSEVEVPDGYDLQSAGAYLAGRGLSALGGLDFEKVEPLLDEMLGCCSRKIEGVEELCTPQSVGNYVQEVKTLIRLRMEALTLNLGFSMPEQESRSGCPEGHSTSSV